MDYARLGKVQKLKISKNQITFQTLTDKFQIDELARGDFDRDGFEDSLISVTSHSTAGSGRAYSLFILHKADSKSRTLQIEPLNLR
jgi:hypothetical protein